MSKWKFSDDKERVVISDPELYVLSQENTSTGSDDTRHIERNKECINEILRFSPSVRSLLDVGCREALAERLCAKLGIKYLGVDISPSSVKFAKSQGRNVVQGDIHKISEIVEEKFDSIISVHSLEHCHDPIKVLKECNACLSDGGYIAVRVPVQKDITVQPLLGDEKVPAHFCVFTPKKLREMLEETGFKKASSRSINEGSRYEECMIVAEKI